MKICMMATTFPRYRGDIVPQFVFGLARALVKQNASVTVIVPHDKETSGYEVMDGVEVRRIYYWLPKSAHDLCYGGGIPVKIKLKPWLAVQLPTLEAAFLSAALRYGAKSDIYNAHWTFTAFPAVFASWITKKPLVTHAYSAEYVPKSLHSINRFIVNNSDSVISISKFTHEVVEKVVSPRFHPIIGYGVNEEKIAPADFDIMAFRNEKGVSPETKLIFAIGRLVERKGYPVLIDAIARLVSQGKPFRLFLAGTGPQHDQLAAQIHSLNMGDYVKLLGFLPDAELCYYLKAADVLVMPSVYDYTGDTEGLGIPLLEAMANGTPVVASEIGGILDIVHHEQNGLLFPPGDAHELAIALERLCGDNQLHSNLVRGGFELINNEFSWETLAKRTLDVFENALRMSRRTT